MSKSYVATFPLEASVSQFFHLKGSGPGAVMTL